MHGVHMSQQKTGKGGHGGSGPSLPAVPLLLRGLREAAAVAPARREAPAPQRLCVAQGVAPNARQHWAEAYTVVGHKVLDTCANAYERRCVCGCPVGGV